MTERRTISKERRGLYTAGLILQIAGAIGFLLCFLGFAFSGFRSVSTHGDEGLPFLWWGAAVACMVALGVGASLRKVAARGVAGSGLVLDPERAREDLEPWARMGGELVRDALDETSLAEAHAPRQAPEAAVVKVRCRECRTLNDEDARFCDHCGAKL